MGNWEFNGNNKVTLWVHCFQVIVDISKQQTGFTHSRNTFWEGNRLEGRDKNATNGLMSCDIVLILEVGS